MERGIDKGVMRKYLVAPFLFFKDFEIIILKIENLASVLLRTDVMFASTYLGPFPISDPR
jgi:hypothetical protein